MHSTKPKRQVGVRCFIAALLCADAIAVFAQPAEESADLARCAEVVPDVARLACFDTLVQRLGDDRKIGSERAENDSAGASSQVENEDAFGAELLDGRETPSPDEIESRLIGEFTGWLGNTTFRLENGQVWRQAEEGRLVFRSTAPLITIRRGAFGTYRLSVEGINRSVRVRRLE